MDINKKRKADQKGEEQKIEKINCNICVLPTLSGLAPKSMSTRAAIAVPRYTQTKTKPTCERYELEKIKSSSFEGIAYFGHLFWTSRTLKIVSDTTYVPTLCLRFLTHCLAAKQWCIGMAVVVKRAVEGHLLCF